MNFSPSMIKAYNDVDMGEMCGILYNAIYVEKTCQLPTTDAQKAGQWFEFMSTGAKLRDGSEPQPETKGKGELTAQYTRLLNQSALWQNWVKYKGITDIQTGIEYVYEYEGMRIKGIADVVAKLDGKPIIIDLKTSGFLNNKWEPYGWVDIDNFSKRFLTIQAPAYVWLYEQLHGERPDFYYYVADSNHNYDRKIFKVDCTNKRIEWFLKQVKFTAASIDFNNSVGWSSSRNYEHCIQCPLSSSCEKRLNHPNVKTIHLT